MRQITRIGANRMKLVDADLATFLFGSERGSLEGFARVLREHQQGRCLYCRREIRAGGDVDHFIAWSRYPVDLGHNLVLAHHGCNAKKRDFLAHPMHLERWQQQNMERADELAQRFAAERLPYDTERTRAIAWWAYEQGERVGAHAWIENERFERLDPGWRNALSPAQFAKVAEVAAPPWPR